MEGLSLDIIVTNGDTAGMPTYPGGKAGSGAAHRIINLMPPHDVYIEPFAGSAAVAKLKRPSALNILCDLDAAALELARDAGKPRSEYRGSSLAVQSDVSGELTRSGEGIPSRWLTFQGDGLDFLEHHHFDGCELVYCDPPYMRETRKSAKDLYNFEWTDHHHSRLLAWAVETPAKVIISGYASVMYREALELILEPWNCETFEAMTRRGLATEVLWYNFTRPTVLHDDRYLGDGFRERERIRRRQSRWVARLQRMDPAERAALQAAIRDLGKP